MLRDLDVAGVVRIKKMKAFNLHSTDVHIKLTARNGLINLGPNQAKLYNGSYAGRTILDVRGKTPAFTLDERLQDIQIGPFLKDADIFDKYHGTGELGLKLTARGLTASDITRTLNGTLNVRLRDGKVEGVNLQKMINDARKAYDQARGKPVRASAQPTDETAFRRLNATVHVTNGLARNDDLILEGPTMRAGGQGTANLVQEQLDYRLQVTLAEDATRKGITVPVHISGAFAKPDYDVDWGAVLKQKVGEKVEKKKEEAKEKVEKKLEDRLKEKLKLRR
jgi:AsmA protein